MIGQKLTKILQSLDQEEFKRLKRALSSPYFATNQRLLKLYDLLKKQYPDFAEEKLQKEKLFKKLYPDKPFNDGGLRVLVREFTTVVEDFIMMERLRSDKLKRKKMLVKEYGQRNLYDYFKKGTQEILIEQDGDFVKDMEFYNECIGLYQEYCFHPLTNNYDASDDSLEKLMDSLDAYFVLAKYRFAQILRNRNTIIKKKAQFRFFDMVRENEDDFFIENKLIVLYELLNKLHSTSDEKYFFELNEIFFPVIGGIKRTDCRIIYFMGLNFCARQINMGKTKYYDEQFDWYEIGLKNNLLIENGKMSDVTFINIVSSACKRKKFRWAENFIDDFSKYLDENTKEDTLNFSFGSLCMSKKDYVQAILLFTQHNYSITYQLMVRYLTIRAAFEQTILDSSYNVVLESHIESFKKYIQRNKYFSEAKILPYKNLLKIIEKFAKKLWRKERKKDIKTWLVETLKKERTVSARSWLEEKVNML